MPIGMLVISGLSACALAAFIFEMVIRPSGTLGLVAALLLFAWSAALFVWTILTTRDRGFRLAFDRPDGFVSAGPYRYVRHPFYSAYLIFWVGCFTAAPSILTAASFLVMLAVYAWAASSEERLFAEGAHADQYQAYRESTGMFVPKRRFLGSKS